MEIVTEGRGSIRGRFVELDVECCFTLACLLVEVVYNCVGTCLLVGVEYNWTGVCLLVGVMCTCACVSLPVECNCAWACLLVGIENACACFFDDTTFASAIAFSLVDIE